MNQSFAELFHKDPTIRAYKYGVAESFDQHAPSFRPLLLTVTAVTTFLTTPGIILSAVFTLAVTFAVNEFLTDLLSLVVPSPTQDSPLLAVAAKFTGFFAPGQTESTAAALGREVGKKTAEDFNDMLPESLNVVPAPR